MPFQPFLFTHSLLNLSATTMYLQHFMLIFQTESGFSKKRCSDVQDWGQVCSFQGKNCGGFGAFTTTASSQRCASCRAIISMPVPRMEGIQNWVPTETMSFRRCPAASILTYWKKQQPRDRA